MQSWCPVLILVEYFRSLQPGECRWLQVFWWELVASFVIQKLWLTKTQTLSCGNVPVLLWNSFGGKFLLSRKEIGSDMSGFQQKQACPGYNIQQWPWRPQCCFWAWQQIPDLLPPRQLLTPHLLAGRETFSLCDALTAKIFENTWLYPYSEQKKNPMKMLVR